MKKSSLALLKPLYGPMAILFVFTFFINMLMLIQPIYMMQIYDRVMVSGSLPTLLYISILAATALVLLAAVDIARNFMASRIAARFEVAVGGGAFRAVLAGPRAALGDVQPLRDLQAVRNFISGRGLFAYLDLPFAPLFIAILYFIHPNLFWMTLGGAAVLAVLAYANNLASADAAKAWSTASMSANLVAQTFARNAETLGAMGMMGNATRAWGKEEAAALNGGDRMTFINSMFAGVSRALRVGLQVAIYGYGGYLVLEGEMTAGMIFAASLIAGRGLQPLDQVIGGWSGFVETRRAWSRLRDAYDGLAEQRATVDLPAPVGRLDVEQVVVFPPQAQPGSEPLLKRVTISVRNGDCIVVLGPSGAGKSTLVRTIIGAVEPRSGAIRVDGSDIRHWNRERLGRYFGYLAQEVELLPGTVAQNISRFESDAKDGDIIAAALKAQVHALIQKLPDGYNTMVGPGRFQFSGGQRQRIGLARAFFGAPRIVVLDEPNANLDSEGETALDRAIKGAKVDGTTVLIVTQRRQITEVADALLIMRDGAVDDFGRREDVFARQSERARQAQTAQAARLGQAGQKVVVGRFPPVVDGAEPAQGGAAAEPRATSNSAE